MEKIIDFSHGLLAPRFAKIMLQATENLQRKQDPPFSDGVYFIEIMKEVVRIADILFKRIFPMIVDPVFAKFFRADGVYCNPDCSKYSLIKIDETYMTYTQGIAKHYPGYGLDSKSFVVNIDDVDIDY